MLPETVLNEGVNNYNKHIKVFPNSFLAGLFNFDEMKRYTADAGSEKAPDASFDFNKKKIINMSKVEAFLTKEEEEENYFCH